MKFLARSTSGSKPMTRRRFCLLQIALWIFSAVLFAALILMYGFWSAPIIFKLTLNVIMIITLPSPKDLFLSYQDYLTWFEDAMIEPLNAKRD
jgi:hypothetical protein